jgi:putative sigma-54 modulation protein
MDIKYTVLDYTLTDAEKEFIDDKLTKLSNLTDIDSVILIKIKEEKYKLYKVELSLSLQDVIIRVSKEDSKFYNCVEEAINTLKDRIVRYKEKSRKYFSGDKDWSDFAVKSAALNDAGIDTDYRPIVKVKKYSDNTPMHPQEAIERMVLLDHKSFLFRNIETGKYSMVYRRDDGVTFGLVEPL